jgi:hypothetical protein
MENMKAFNEKWIMAVVEPLRQLGVSKKGHFDTLINVFVLKSIL